ncbi:MAG TPA: hypothetical protein VHK67_06660 [Rhabdochlamydiaceae bacterium]|jgi:hypothetical protein|nr:hypothetical protein [Rhabdochlamydiaceae bacterium]
MADLTNISGPVPNEPHRQDRKDREIKPGTDKFKDLMKIDKSGEREKKKKKQKTESEEDTKAELRTGSPTESKAAEAKKAAEFKKIQAIGESEKRQSMAQKRAEESTAAEEIAAAQINQKKIESLNLEKIEPSPVEKKGAPSYLGQIEQEDVVEEKIEAIEKKEELETTTLLRKERKEAKAPDQPFAPPATSTLGPLFIPPAPSVSPAYTHLSPEMLLLFEKMISQIFIMQASGVNETVIHLNTPEFSSSIFAGAQIVIKEFSTAPLAFNIEFLGSLQNSLYFEQNIASLRAAFASEDRKYSINRIESRLLSKQEKPLFRRKEKTSDKGKEESR